MEKINIYALIRIAFGCLFGVSGFEKIISPSQNFLYVVQTYDIFNGSFDHAIVLGVPWIEFLTGVFLLLGLWLKSSLKVLFVLLTGFLFVVGQALARRLPIDECGCFGGLFSFPLPVVFAMDAALLFLAGLVYHKMAKVRCLSVDGYFQKNARK
jgi:uncharacterized membrane protein YphA (DoxX/SURF4 family)